VSVAELFSDARQISGHVNELIAVIAAPRVFLLFENNPISIDKAERM